MQELKSGDLFIEDGEKYGDWRKDLISKEDYEQNFEKYCRRLKLPSSIKSISESVKAELVETILETDKNIENNHSLTFDGENFILKKHRALDRPNGLAQLEENCEN